MITLDDAQMRVLNRDTRERFAHRLTAQLRDAYPELLGVLPAALAQRLVGARIDYLQERYQIRFQSALATYLHYCCAVGAAIDRHPAFQRVLDDPALFPDDIPALLTSRVDAGAWQEAQEAARRTDWLTGKVHLRDRLAARYCWALHGKAAALDDDALRAAIERAARAARAHRIEDERGMAAFAVCAELLGPDFPQRGGRAWVAPIFHDTAILPALRGATLAGCAELEWSLVI